MKISDLVEYDVVYALAHSRGRPEVGVGAAIYLGCTSYGHEFTWVDDVAYERDGAHIVEDTFDPDYYRSRYGYHGEAHGDLIVDNPGKDVPCLWTEYPAWLERFDKHSASARKAAATRAANRRATKDREVKERHETLKTAYAATPAGKLSVEIASRLGIRTDAVQINVWPMPDGTTKVMATLGLGRKSLAKLCTTLDIHPDWDAIEGTETP